MREGGFTVALVENNRPYSTHAAYFSSEALANVLQQVSLVSPLAISVLLTGDNGTGKTQLARAIHDNSPRRDEPFLEVLRTVFGEVRAQVVRFDNPLTGGISSNTVYIAGRTIAS